MRIRSRLLRLERTVRDRAPDPVVPDEPILTDEEEAERTGKFLWCGFAIDRRFPRPWRPPPCNPLLGAWHKAAEAAWSAGHREYQTGMRDVSMAVWLDWKPDIVRHRRTHGVWVPTGEPVRAEILTPDEFDHLPIEERIAVLREHRGGYWSKLGPASAARRQTR
jgi:hypothetical protein